MITPSRWLIAMGLAAASRAAACMVRISRAAASAGIAGRSGRSIFMTAFWGLEHERAKKNRAQDNLPHLLYENDFTPDSRLRNVDVPRRYLTDIGSFPPALHS